MSDPIDSSGWTGEPARPTYRPNQLDFWGNYARAKRERDALPPQVRALRKVAAWLVVSQLLLWVAHYFVRSVIPDRLVADRSWPLVAWAAVAIGVGAWQFTSTSRSLLALKRAVLATLIGVTVAVAFLYGYLALTSYAEARPLRQERAFEFYICPGRCRSTGHYVHQRSDGTTVEGEHLGPPVPHGPRCTIVQRLSGEYGFLWVRVVERSPPSKSELHWPIRREDCFSDKPIQSLTG